MTNDIREVQRLLVVSQHFHGKRQYTQGENVAGFLDLATCMANVMGMGSTYEILLRSGRNSTDP